MKQKISLFGAGGFIGSWLANMGRDTYVFHHDRDKIRPITNRILWLVSTVDNYNIKIDPTLDIRTNLVLLIQALEAARNIYGSNFEFNFASSWFVYGKTKDLPASEDSYCNPTGFYSITKRAAEQMLISYCETYGIKWRILRFANILGVGDYKISRKKNAVQYMLRELVQGRSIDLYRGEFVRDFMDVRDLVNAVNLILEEGKLNEIYNVGSGVGVLVSHVIDYVLRETGSTNVNLIEPPAFHTQVQNDVMYLDIEKLKSLGFAPDFSLAETLDWLIDYYHDEQTKTPRSR